MAGKLAKTDYQILYRIICDSMPHAQRQKFLELRTHNPEKAWHIIEEIWEEVISHIVQSFMKKEQEGAADGTMKLIHREPCKLTSIRPGRAEFQTLSEALVKM